MTVSIFCFGHFSDPPLLLKTNTGWLRLVGSLKLQVSFAKEPYKRDYLLQKTPIILQEPTNRSHPIMGILYFGYFSDPPQRDGNI